jgi:hypothetical protein
MGKHDIMKAFDNRLYVLVRTDLDSLTPGKAAAQVAHAAQKFSLDYPKESKQHAGDLGFGTTVVLGWERHIHFASEFAGYPSGVIHDPTYPLEDGKFVHKIPLDTCFYVYVAEGDNVPETLRFLKRY